MPKILIFGAGYLGNKFAAVLPDSVLSTANIADLDEAYDAIDTFQPDCVLNTAGKTGRPNVDWCEANKTPTFYSNAVGALMLAKACQDRGVHLIHLGSGCIFYGPSPDPAGWRETDFANPSAFYSRSKYAADIVLSDLPGVAVVRLRMPIDSMPEPRNLIYKLAAYPKIIDVENSVSVVDDLIGAVKGIMEKRGEGVFHAVNEGRMKHRDLIRLYEEIVDPTHTNEWIPNDELVNLGLATRGRSNCFLQNTRLKALGIEMRPIEVALRDCMEKYAAALAAQKVAESQT